MREIIEQELERIRSRDKNGVLYPRKVVAAARATDNPLHPMFEWNNRKAGDEWRLQQARQIISRYHVTITNATTSRVRGYVSLKSDRAEGGGYRAIGEVISEETMRAELLQNALEELASLEQRYVRLSELKPVFQAARKVREIHEPKESATT